MVASRRVLSPSISWVVCPQEEIQSPVDFLFTLSCSQIQQLKIQNVRLLWSVLLLQEVAGSPEAACRIQIRPIPVVLERPRLPDQPGDHVLILNEMAFLAAQARQILHTSLGVVDVEVLGVKPGVYGFPDQPAVNGVGFADHPDGAGRFDSYA